MEAFLEDLLNELTVEEKVSMVHGATLFSTGAVPRLGIPSLCFSDGPMGVRCEFAGDQWVQTGNGEDVVTYFPCNSALASTWNPALAYRMGQALGREFRGRGKDVALAPGINIKRNPLCGRIFEYMSEDPWLVGTLAAPMVRGIQENDVAACPKHFAANAQETGRMTVDTLVSRRALEEIYFPGFLAAVGAGCASLMGAYNRIGGEYCCQSKWLLGEILRKTWGFDGVVVSDWGGVHHTQAAAESGLDVEMDVTSDFAGHYLADALLEKLGAGEVSESKLDEKVRHILKLMYRLKMIGPEKNMRSAGGYNLPQNREAALAVAQEGVILLKNEGLLPLQPEKLRRLAVIGANAVTTHAPGGGSAEIQALYEITPLLGIQMALGGNTRVVYAPGYYQPERGSRPEISWQASSKENKTRKEETLPPEALAEKLRREALEACKDCDGVIFVGGLDHDYDVEGVDRNDMRLPYGQDALLKALLEARPDTVVVLLAGSPVEMPWLDSAKALLWSYYAGMEGGTAIAQTIFGKVNPSGKLAETILRSYDQCNAPLGGVDTVEFSEGVMVGYRYYNTHNIPVNFPFGHGLSYTRFDYGEAAVSGREISLKITNAGALPGKETVQLYVAPLSPCALERPCHQLRFARKICLQPGESARVRFPLSWEDFAIFDERLGRFCPVAGRYDLQIGASSRDIRTAVTVCLETTGENITILSD